LLSSPAHQGRLAQALYNSLVGFRQYLEGGRRPLAPGDRPVQTNQQPASPGPLPPGASSR
jgi:hypothetical protein